VRGVMTPPASVTVVDVTLRDGIQLEAAFVPTEAKVALAHALAEAGVTHLEVTAFVSPRALPQLADAEAVMRGIDRRPGVVRAALVPNRRGAERALAAGADLLRFVVSATEAGNRKNVSMSVDASLAELATVVELARSAGRRVEAVLGLAFGCPLSGPVPVERIQDLAKRIAETGVSTLVLADSYGFASPTQIVRVIERVQSTQPGLRLGCHLHDTRGLGLANAWAAMQAGVTCFDAALGGAGAGGGLTEAVPAGGNLASEELVNLCEELGVTTGIDVDRLSEAARSLARIVGHPLPGRLHQVDSRRRLFARLAAEQAARSGDAAGRSSGAP
jgi:hydroxymethylglutaryl-CoA lyase